MKKRMKESQTIMSNEITDDHLEEALGSIKLGFDSSAASQLIEYFHNRLQANEPFNRHVFDQFIGMAFERIVEHGWSADQAFGLKLGRGRYERANTIERDISGVAYIVYLMERGHTWHQALGAAANLLFDDGKGDKAMEKAYAQYHAEIRSLNPEEIIGLLPDGAQI